MKIFNRSRTSAAKTTGGIVGGGLAALAIVLGILTMVAVPVVGGIAAGLAVAGVMSGAGGTICAVLAGLTGASIASGISIPAGIAVMAVGAGIAGVAGAAAAGLAKGISLGVKGAAAGVKKLLSFGKKKAPKAAAKETAPVQAEKTNFKTTKAKPAFDAATQQAPVVNDNKPVAQPKTASKLTA